MHQRMWIVFALAGAGVLAMTSPTLADPFEHFVFPIMFREARCRPMSISSAVSDSTVIPDNDGRLAVWLADADSPHSDPLIYRSDGTRTGPVSDEIVPSEDTSDLGEEYGACCLLDRSCVHTYISTCIEVYDGTWMGPGVNCEDAVCCAYPFADDDGDGDVDQTDFASFQLCYTGIGNGPSDYECWCFDRDMDADIDKYDLAEFKKCYTGPGIVWTAAATPDCDP